MWLKKNIRLKITILVNEWHDWVKGVKSFPPPIPSIHTHFVFPPSFLPKYFYERTYHSESSMMEKVPIPNNGSFLYSFYVCVSLIPTRKYESSHSPSNTIPMTFPALSLSFTLSPFFPYLIFCHERHHKYLVFSQASRHMHFRKCVAIYIMYSCTWLKYKVHIHTILLLLCYTLAALSLDKIYTFLVPSYLYHTTPLYT